MKEKYKIRLARLKEAVLEENIEIEKASEKRLEKFLDKFTGDDAHIFVDDVGGVYKIDYIQNGIRMKIIFFGSGDCFVIKYDDKVRSIFNKTMSFDKVMRNYAK